MGPGSQEAISIFLFTVTPAKAGVQETSRILGSGIHQNDARRGLMHFEIDSKPAGSADAAR